MIGGEVPQIARDAIEEMIASGGQSIAAPATSRA
jgi:hypothetical protein